MSLDLTHCGDCGFIHSGACQIPRFLDVRCWDCNRFIGGIRENESGMVLLSCGCCGRFYRVFVAEGEVQVIDAKVSNATSRRGMLCEQG